MALSPDNNLGADGDRLYSLLMQAHDGLDAAQSQRLNARLLLLLMNQIGDAVVIEQALQKALQGINNAPSGAAKEKPKK